MSLLGAFHRGARRRGLAGIIGPVLRPADPGYAAEIAAFNPTVTRRPGIVVGAQCEDDVVAAVVGAGADGLPVGVKGAGHGTTADPTVPVLISTRRLDAVAVDPRARTARVGAGATWAQVVAAAAPHGLTALVPSSTRVGVAGYTLGGGLGLLGRRYGFAADHLRRLRLVTADGRPHEIDADRAPELHWALRGAGRSGFGVVTELEFALFPLVRLYGGGIVWPAAAAPHGLTALTPSSTRVGVAGYTLGGGLGLLGRRYGFAADHLRRLRLVTADGRPHEIDADRAPELHWALRGAGRSGFGVVTELEFALFPLARLYGGGIVWPGAAAADVLHAWREWAPTLPDDAGTSVALLRVPRDAAWPAPLHNRTVVHVRFTGADVDAVSGDALLAPMRAVGSPVLDEVGELSPTATDAVHREPTSPVPVHDGGAALRDLPAAAVDALLDAADVDIGGSVTTVELRVLGGALGRPAAVPSAVAGRGTGFALHVQGRLSTPVHASAAVDVLEGRGGGVRAAVAAVVDAVAPWSLGAALPTFAGAGEPDALWSRRDRARLHLLRRAVDGDGMFAAPPPP